MLADFIRGRLNIEVKFTMKEIKKEQLKTKLNRRSAVDKFNKYAIDDISSASIDSAVSEYSEDK